ncbi:MAG: type II secretion system F family protein [Bryobacterales bacterium]|nr:type II secretion system F family protein [Bryobacterales bacterium]
MLGAALFFTLAFATLAALLWSGLLLFRQEENPLDDRLEALQSSAGVQTTTRRRRRAGGGILNSLLYVISLVPGGDEWLRETERELQSAGVRRREVIAIYSVGNVAFLLVLVVVGQYFQWGAPVSNKIVMLVVAGILGWLLPRQILYRLVARYRRRLQQALPDTIDLLGIVLGTGLALDQALLRVSEEMQHIYPELANEFYTVVMQVKAGQERSKAFNALVRRTGVEDVKSLAAMIVQSERFGTSLSQALKVYAESLRTRRRLRAEAAIGKAGIKMLFPIVLFILPALFVVVLVPALISILRNLGGGIGAGAR